MKDGIPIIYHGILHNIINSIQHSNNMKSILIKCINDNYKKRPSLDKIYKVFS